MSWKNKIEKLMQSLDQKNRIILFFFIGLMVVGFSQIKPTAADNVNDRFQIDTIIPVGYVLIPIKILNADAISAVIGTHGVADIYSTLQGERSKLLFARTKIIKSPIEESSFSILVKESKAHLLTQNENPFFAAVQNPKVKAIERDDVPKNKPGIRIIYQN